MLLKTLISVVFLVTVAVGADAQASAQLAGKPITIGASYEIASEVLGEGREILVALPAGYEASTQSYPVIYLTEGQIFFSYTADLIARLSDDGSMPASILVATKMASPARFGWLQAGSDKAGQYRDFIEKDVIAFVEANFRTSQHRTLVGWEYGGGFAIDTLQKRPDLFDAYIASSPFPVNIEELDFAALEGLAEQKPGTKKFLYFGVAEIEGMVREGADRFVEHLQASAPAPLEWQHRIFAGDRTVIEHTTTAYPVFLAGLGAYYRDYRTYMPVDVAAFKADGGVAYAKSYYSKRARKYGTEDVIASSSVWWLLRKTMEADDLPLFEDVLAAADAFADPWNPNWYVRYADFLLSKGRQQAGMGMYKKTIAEYPENLRVVAGYAAALEGAGDRKAAHAMYEKAVALAEEHSSSRLAELKAKLSALK